MSTSQGWSQEELELWDYGYFIADLHPFSKVTARTGNRPWEIENEFIHHWSRVGKVVD